MTSPKQTLELHYLTLFTAKVSDLRPGQASHGERPDFVWQHSRGVLGLEITRLFKRNFPDESPEQIREGEQSAIIKRALQLYEERGLPKLDLRIVFANVELAKARRQILASKIAKAIEFCLPDAGRWMVIENDAGNNPWFPEEISYVSIAKIDELAVNQWSASHMGWMQIEFIAELQHCMDKKNIELPNYLKKCAQCWLLIVADGNVPSSFFHPGVDTLEHVYHSLFARTFFLDALTGDVHELKTAANGV